MSCLPCMAFLAGLGEMTQQQKFDYARYQELLGLHAKLASRAKSLPASPEKNSTSKALNEVGANLNQIGGVAVKSPGSATWFDSIFGSVPQSGSTGPDYLSNPALFDREYRENMAELNRIDQYISSLTAAPAAGKTMVSQPDVTTKPLTPSGSSGAAPYKSSDWTSYLPQPKVTLGIPDKKTDYTNLIIFTAMIGAGAYLLWPGRKR